MQIKHRFLSSTDFFFPETTTNYCHGKRNYTSESTDKSLSSLKYRASILIAVTGTLISTVLLVVIGYQLRSRIILCRQATSHQRNMFSENANVYEE